MTSAKSAIKALLENADHGIKVYDDQSAPILGKISEKWTSMESFGKYGWMITVGPVVGSDAQISSHGALSKWIVENIQIDIWVLERQGMKYKAERIRGDLVQDVDRCLHHFATSPGTGFKVVNLASWAEMDEDGLLRSSCRAYMEYEKSQT